MTGDGQARPKPGQGASPGIWPASPLRTVRLTKQLRLDLERLVQVQQTPRGGTLFGRRQDEELHIEYLLPSGPRAQDVGEGGLFHENVSFLLGTVAAMSVVMPGLSWQGYGLSLPRGWPYNRETLDARVQEAGVHGLIDDARPLLVVSQVEAVVQVAAYVLRDGQVAEVPVCP